MVHTASLSSIACNSPRSPVNIPLLFPPDNPIVFEAEELVLARAALASKISRDDARIRENWRGVLRGAAFSSERAGAEGNIVMWSGLFCNIDG